MHSLLRREKAPNTVSGSRENFRCDGQGRLELIQFK